MKKGKSSTFIVLALEIAAIAVLHAVKINSTDKIAGKGELSKSISASQTEVKARSSFTLADFSFR
ncbi:hypothetical protein ACX0G9_28615 [Flavitalea flava]